MPQRIKALLLENIHPSSHDTFREAGVDLDVASGALSEDDLIARLAGVQVLGIRSKTRVTRRVLEAAGKDLFTVGCFCIGTNQVDLIAANQMGVPVFNAPFSNTRSVAELVIAEIIALARNLSDRIREMHDGKWRKVATNSFEIRGKTLGIVGYGHIGSQVGVLAEAMGMRVVFFDILKKLPMGNNRPVATLGELLAESDFVTLHVPATPQTEMMIRAPELAKMRKGSYLINASRGSVVDIHALADALREHRLSGAAIDVFPDEPETNTDAFATDLRGLGNTIITPHVAGSTEEAQEAIGREVATSLSRFLKTGGTTGAVNFPQVELPLSQGTHRILNVHRNVPGVLRDINRIVSDRNANIRSQVLATDTEIGYLIMDLDQEVSADVRSDMAKLPTSIRTRILS